MPCFITVKKVRGDESGKLELIVRDASNGNVQKEDILIASINNDLERFLSFANKVLENRNLPIVLTSVPQIIELLNTKDNKFSVNVVKDILNKFYNSTHPGINTVVDHVAYIDKCGFSSISAMQKSVEYCATLLANADWINEHNTNKLKFEQLINQMRNVVGRDFIKVFEEFCEELLINSKNENHTYYKQREHIQKLVDQYRYYTNISKQLNDLATKANQEKDKEEKENLIKQYNELNDNNKYNIFYRKAAISALIHSYGSITEKNLFNLFTQLDIFNTDGTFDLTSNFFNKIINNRRCLNVIDKNKNEYERLIEQQDLIDAEDITDEDSEESEYEMYRNWDDKDRRSFTDFLDEDIRKYFDSLFEMSVPYKEQTSDNVYMYYSKDNEAGVPIPYNFAFIQSQIIAKADFSSLENFINSIEKMSNSITKLYGLGKLVKAMNENKNFARHIFALHDYKAFQKVIVTLNQDGSITSDISNRNANATNQLILDLMNSIRSNYLAIGDRVEMTEYINKLSNLKSKLNEYSNTSLVRRDGLKNSYINEITEAIQKIDPQFDFTIIRNYVNQDENIKQNLLDLLGNVLSIYQNCEKLVKQSDNAAEEKGKRISYFDMIDVNKSGDLKKNIIDFCKAISPYSATKYELNSRNAERNLSSDLIKNSYISRVFDQIKNGGIDKLLEKFKECPQYKKSILYTGIHEGNINIPGLFKEVNGNWEVDKDGLEYFDKYYFNGIKTEDDEKSVMYAEMSKGDYFITWLQSYFNPIVNTDDTVNKNSVINAFIQTPSDAPKNFIFRLPKIGFGSLIQEQYDTYKSFMDKYIVEQTKLGRDVEEIDREEILTEGINRGELKFKVNHSSPMFVAFRQTLVNELQGFISQLNNVFEYVDGGWELKQSEEGLIDNVHFKRDDNDKPILMKFDKITKNYKLTGSWFKFDKLFNITTSGGSKFDCNARMEELLHLYGESGIIKYDKAINNLYIDPNFIYEIGANNNIEMKDTILVQKDGVLELSENYPVEMFDDIVDDFIKHYFVQCTEKIFEYKTINNSLENKFTIMQMIEALFGNIIAEYEFADLLLGDGKFYKDANTILKRAKEAQAGGSSYAAFSFADSLIDGIISKGEKITVKDHTFRIYNRGTKTWEDMEITNGFRAVTVYNTEKSSKIVDNMYKELQKIIGDNLSKTTKLNKTKIEQRAREIAYKIVKGYGYEYEMDGVTKLPEEEIEKTKVNDAQSYITFEEFVRRKVLDGTVDNYSDIIDAIMKLRKGEITINDIDIDKIQAKIQVQKNFYFDIHYDKQTKLDYPRQIKNAEFVLIPELIKGTELEKVWQWMNEKGIDQINTEETSKATKRNLLTLWDNEGNLNESFANELDNERNIEEYKYMYLYKQQDVVSHLKDKENKAGIQLLKKIADNATPETIKYVNQLFDNYCANIKTSYMRVIRSLGWIVNEDGSLSNKNNPDDRLDFTEFYKKARYEAKRLGKDSQFMEYLTPEVYGDPKMPNWMNNVSDKIMSIAQSIFNSTITRQTLPGWHAVQVTSVGHKVKDENGEEHELKYHPQVTNENGEVIQEAYAEILVPKWWKNKILKGKDITIEDLQEQGLDIQLGYRIPTEGKQSVSIFKVVGFLNDIYDSTVMVPDEWVTQTGSDMDVDTIYDIYFEFYVDGLGNVHKYETIDFDNADERTLKQGYIDYIKDNLDRKRDEHYTDNIEEQKKLAREELDKKLSDKYQNIPTTKDILKTLDDNINNLSKDLQNHVRILYHSALNDTKSEKGFRVYDAIKYFETNLNNYISKLNRNKQDTSKLYGIDRCIQAIKAIYEMKIQENKEVRLNGYFNNANEYAKNNNLYSYEEWLRLPNIEKQVQASRNNAILDAMIAIMRDPNSREENYSRSNFDALSLSKSIYDLFRESKITSEQYIEAIKIKNDKNITDKERITKLKKILNSATSSNRSCYNPLDQIDFMEAARSGATLKAFSVTRDTFLSLNNYMHGELSSEHEFLVRYSSDKYNVDLIKESYDIDKNNIVKHKQLGWSKNNRNVIGALITPYSSQTTAHILDAMKTGSIFNENKFTFGTFKTLIDCGVDYDTAISFLMQPSITEIVKAYNESASIYISSTNKPIQTAIKRISKKLDIKIENNHQLEDINDYTSYNDVLRALNSYFSRNDIIDKVNKIFNYDILTKGKETKLQETRFILDENDLCRRLTSKLENENALIYDLCMLFEFDKLYKTTQNIENLTRISNPDKFGAKQTIKDTKQILNNIKSYRAESGDKNGEAIGSTILINGKNFVDALYPLKGLDENGFEIIDIDNSAYKYQAAFLTYSTITSVKVNEELFELDKMLLTDEMLDEIRKLLGKNIDNKTFKDLKKYYVNYLYNSNMILSNPITIDFTPGFLGEIMIDEDLQEQYEKDIEKTNDLHNREKERIFGRNAYSAAKFVPKSIDKNGIPINDIELLKEDVNNFNRLSPAQKVIWIKQYCKNGNAGIFEYLNASVFYDRNGEKKSIITYNDQIENIEQLFNDFNDAFNCIGNTFDKLMFRLAAIDLIKYAFIAEGFNFKQKAISKLITNAAIYNSISENGMSLVEGEPTSFKNIFGKIFTSYNNGSSVNRQQDVFFERFIRANSNLVKEINWYRIPWGQPKYKGILSNKIAEGGVIFNSFDKKQIDFIMSSLGITNINEIPKYIKIKSKIKKGVEEKSVATSVLYKTVVINNSDDTFTLILLPKPLLDKTETDNVSSNKNYFNSVDPDVYEEIIVKLINEQEKDRTASNIQRLITDNSLFNKWKTKRIVEQNELDSANTLNEWLQSTNQFEKDVAKKIISSIQNIFNNESNPTNGLFVYPENPYIHKIIKSKKANKQFVNINGEQKLVNLTFYYSDKLRDAFNEYRLGNTEKALNMLNNKEKQIIAEWVKQGFNSRIIRVDLIDTNNKQEENFHRSTTEDVGFDEINQTNEPNITEKIESSIKVNPIITSVSILGQHLYRLANSGDIFAENFKKYIDTNRIDLKSKASLRANQNSLYNTIASAIKMESETILHDLNNIQINVSEDPSVEQYETFKITDKKLYKYLENPDNYFKVVHLLMKAKTFGRNIKEAVLYLKSDDESIQRNIDQINQSIKNVCLSNEVKEGFINIFEEHFAKHYSKNPNIQRGIEYLRQSFNDSDLADKLFSDIGELDNKQVQTVLKYVYGIINEATQLTAPKVRNKFTKEYDELINKGANLSHIIDDKTGKLIQEYNDNFIKDKYDLLFEEQSARRELAEAYRAYYSKEINEEKYNKFAKKYFDTVHKRKQWLKTYTHQELVDSYYDEDYDNETFMMENCYDYYITYRRLRDRLNDYKNRETELTENELNEVKDLIIQIYNLSSKFNTDGSDKTDEEIKLANNFKKYIDKYKEIQEKYFEYKEISGWTETKDRYVNIIKKYDETHTNESIESKLKNKEYKEAYDWLSANVIIHKNDAVWEKLNNYEKLIFEKEGKTNALNSVIQTAIEKSNARDKFGIVDGRKLTKEQRELVKSLTLNKYAIYDNDSRIFGDIPNNDVIYTKEFYDILSKGSSGYKRMKEIESKYNNNPEKYFKDEEYIKLYDISHKKLELVSKINKYLEVGRDKTNNHINTVLLFKTLTTEELNDLKNCLNSLKSFKNSTKTKDEWKEFFKTVEFKTNDTVYNIELQKAKENLSKTDLVLWHDIFSDYDSSLGVFTASNQLYGYMVAKDDKYIDKKRTEAIRFVRDNVEYVPNQYYYEALNEAIEKDYENPGYYNEWYNENHIYNPYTGKYEPLRFWCSKRINPNSELLRDENGHKLDEFEYEPSFDNTSRYIRDEYKNKPNGIDYNYRNSNFKNFNGNKYSTNNILIEKDKQLQQLLINLMNTYAKSNSAKKFVNDGFLPRDASYPVDARYLVQQSLGTIGLDIPTDNHKSWNKLDYVDDAPIETNMFSILKAKGYKELLKYPDREMYSTEKEYKEVYDKVKKENEVIEKHNRELESNIMNKDWKEVFIKLINQGEEAAARERIKDTMYLLLEDMKTSIEDGGNYSYKINPLTGNVIKDKNNAGVEESTPRKYKQENTIKLLETAIHRIIYKEFKKPHKLNTVAAVMQNVTSAKYMIFNLTGGIANVSTGKANIFNETFARQYFTYGDFNKARLEYISNIGSYVTSWLSGEEASSNKTLALIKLLNVVNYDEMFERKESENIKEYITRVREVLYSMQSMGEHYMQNTAMLAMLHSHRIYRNNKNKWEIGSFDNYSWQVEQIALLNVIDKIDSENKNHDGVTLRKEYEQYLIDIKQDLNTLAKFDKFRRDFNAEFIKKFAGKDVKKIVNLYVEEKKKLLEKAKKDFENYKTVYEAFDFKDGYCEIRPDSNMTGQMFGELKEKIQSVNNKIHGVYNKKGAASIEQEFWGSLVMQYHKHIYPGLMKRWRINGYFNEIRGTIEKGSYISFADFLGTEFYSIKDHIKERKAQDDTNVIMASIQETFKAVIRTVSNLEINWKLLPDWEKQNMMRTLGDLAGMLGSMCMAVALYCMTDDDEIKDSETLSIMLYCADRCYSEAQMYTHWGLKSEAKTLWSSPIAAANGPSDLIDICNILYNTLADDEYNPYYTTGQYKGQSKAVVRLYRNIPAYRIYNRLSHMSKNNSYYRLGQTGITKNAKNIADTINPDK